MKITTSLCFSVFVFLILSSGFNSSYAGIVFDGTLGTNAPPPTIGGYSMTPFSPDNRTLFNLENQVFAPSYCNKTLDFSSLTSHYRIGNGWQTWSNGYTGDVYFMNGSQITITLPFKTNAFYCYVEPNVFSTFSVQADANDGTSSGPIMVNGVSGATGFAFYTTGACNLTSITITVDPNAFGFAVGEFGINLDQCDPNIALSCKNINVSLDANCQATITPQMLLTGDNYCYCDFVVNLTNYNVPVPNPIDSHYLNQHIVATVLNTVTGNSCWSDIKVEDKLSPTIICRDYVTDCYLFNIDFPSAWSGSDCSPYTVKTTNETVDHYDCNEVYLKAVHRDLLITDSNGNTDQCTQTIYVKRISANDIGLPEKTVFLECNYPYLLDENGHPSPLETGYPWTTLSNDQHLGIWPLNILLDCNLLIQYEDIDLGEINCVHKIMRNWTVREWWCNTEIVQSVVQIIIIRDTYGPVITHAPYGFDATTGRRNCTATVLLPGIQAFDYCHNNLRVDIIYPGGVLENKNGGYAEIPVGEDTIFYRVYDGCYNLTEYWMIVHVRDETEPVAVCDRNTVVALNHSGYNWVPADVFDDGSFDECALDHFEVRRMDTDFCGGTGADDWGPEVGFCCEDVGHMIMVAFKAVDRSGNEAICMVNVEVQDKDRPLIVCLPDITVDCRFDIDYNHLEVFGKIVTDTADRDTIVIDPKYYHIIGGHPFDGIASDNCPPTMIETIDTSHINQCGIGYIVRTFRAEDRQGNQSDICTQIITVVNTHPLNGDSIIWPLDLDTLGICDPDALIPERLSFPYSKPIVNDDECSLIGYSYDDQIFAPTIPGDPCFKILRTWKILDWCQRDKYDNVIIWSHVQYIKVRNNVDPLITRITQDTIVCSYDINCRPMTVSFSVSASDDCTPANQMLYTYKIDLDSDGTIDVVRAGIGENVAQGTWPLGRHIVYWEVEDRCGNTAKKHFTLDLRNCKSPVAYCLNGLSTNLTPMDMDGDGIPETAIDTVWAKDFDAGSYHNCGYPVRLSFSADVRNNFRVYNCDSIGTRTVELWVTDVNGNTSFCRTFIDVQDNTGFCPQTTQNSNVTGLIATEKSDGVQNVAVGGILTDENGKYAFQQVPNGNNMVIKPEKNEGWLNGVTTADIVKIQRHILGIEPFVSPYKIIAADVNRSHTITAKDVSDLRRLILGVITEVPGNTSWRFVDQSYQFNSVNTALDENYPEFFEINHLNGNMNLNFIAVKTGDVNISAATKGFNSNISRSRNTMELQVDEQKLARDESQELVLRVANGSEYEGMQFTLQWDLNQLELEGVQGNDALKIRDDNYSLLHAQEGKLTFSWNGNMKDADWILKLRFKAKQNVRISEALIVNSTITPTVSVVKESGNEGQLILNFKGSSSSEFVVLQNEPNPWNRETAIGMLLPAEGEVGITVYDITGKVYFRDRKLMNKGYNEYMLNKDQLNHSGVYYYQIEFQSNTVSRKMLVTE
jgi:hypothetical protein